jgi:hypothetical protein
MLLPDDCASPCFRNSFRLFPILLTMSAQFIQTEPAQHVAVEVETRVLDGTPLGAGKSP